MDKELEAAMKAEVAEAARILREDGVSTNLTAIRAKLDKQFPDEPEPTDPNNPQPPPKKDDPNPPPEDRKKRTKGWWPEVEGGEDES